MKKRKPLFCITDVDDSVARAVHQGMAIVVRTVTSVVTPAEITWDDLAQWVRENAKHENEEWSLDDEVIGQFDSTGDDDLETLIAEVASWLYGKGVSVIDAKVKAYVWE